MSLVFAAGVIFLAAIGAFGYMWYIKRMRKKQLERVQRLELENDTIRIVEEYKKAQVAKAWEDFDREQWEIRYQKAQGYFDNKEE